MWAGLAITVTQDVPATGYGCIPTVSPDKSIRFVYYWFSLVAFDFVVFLMTLVRGLRVLGHSRTLVKVLLRDGVMYFVAMLISEVTNFVVFWNVSPDLIAINWTYNSTITVVLLSRLVMNLREVRRTGELAKSVSSPPTSTSLKFATRRSRRTTMSSIVGNMGASLHYSAEENDEVTQAPDQEEGRQEMSEDYDEKIEECDVQSC